MATCKAFVHSAVLSFIGQGHHLGHFKENMKMPEAIAKKHKKGSRLALITASLAATALLISGCAPGGATDAGGELGAISKEFPSDVDIELILATWEDDATVTALVDAFEAKHPNVTIKIVASSFNDYLQNVKLQMSSEEAPDIVQAGQGYTMMGPLVQAGTMRPIDDYAELYGWADRFGPFRAGGRHGRPPGGGSATAARVAAGGPAPGNPGAGPPRVPTAIHRRHRQCAGSGAGTVR